MKLGTSKPETSPSPVSRRTKASASNLLGLGFAGLSRFKTFQRQTEGVTFNLKFLGRPAQRRGNRFQRVAGFDEFSEQLIVLACPTDRLCLHCLPRFLP